MFRCPWAFRPKDILAYSVELCKANFSVPLKGTENLILNCKGTGSGAPSNACAAGGYGSGRWQAMYRDTGEYAAPILRKILIFPENQLTFPRIVVKYFRYIKTMRKPIGKSRCSEGEMVKAPARESKRHFQVAREDRDGCSRYRAPEMSGFRIIRVVPRVSLAPIFGGRVFFFHPGGRRIFYSMKTEVDSHGSQTLWLK